MPRRGKGLWRNGSASDSRSDGWAFESLWPHFLYGYLNVELLLRSEFVQYKDKAHNMKGDLAQMVKRSLSMREALGSMPRFSIFVSFLPIVL